MTVNLHSHDQSIVDTVMNRSDSRYDQATVGEFVENSVQFNGAPVQDYVQVLVIRKVMEDLRRLEPLGFPGS